jgi:hypothetical protein
VQTGRFDIPRCIFDVGQSHALCPYSNAMRGSVSVRLVFADLQSPVGSSRGACVLGPRIEIQKYVFGLLAATRSFLTMQTDREPKRNLQRTTFGQVAA